MRVIVIGYGPGGAAAALAARMFDSKTDIKIITEETRDAHRKPGASLALEYPETDALRIADWSFEALAKKRIEVMSGTSVTTIDGDASTVTIDGKGGKKTLDYDRLILATGGIPNRPSIPGVDLPGVYTIQDMSDTSQIGAKLEGMSRIAVVGAGFSGLETAERLLHLGKETHMVVRSRFMRRQLEEPMSLELRSRLPQSLVVHDGLSPTSVEGTARVTGIQTDDGPIAADAVLFMTGVRPNVKLATDLGLKIGSLGGIVVDEKMQTSMEHVYAVGDCIEMIDPVSSKPLLLPVGSVAARAGRQAGVAAVGGRKVYQDTLLRLQYDRIFGTDIVCVGHSSTTARNVGIETEVQYFEDPAEFAKSALVVDKKGHLIGGQVIASRMGARLGYEILERVQSGATLQEKPLSKPRHERFKEYLEATFGPIR
jgi:NAD(P)H-nitrite reductase large subunit